MGRLPASRMTPQSTDKVEGALYKGKVHFRMPSAEAAFAFPDDEPMDQETMAKVVTANGGPNGNGDTAQ